MARLDEDLLADAQRELGGRRLRVLVVHNDNVDRLVARLQTLGDNVDTDNVLAYYDK